MMSLRLRCPSFSFSAVERLETRLFLDAGVVDPSFGTGGAALTAAPSGDAVLRDIAVLPDGRFMTVGTSSNTSQGTRLNVMRFNSDGSRDVTFGSDGAAQSFIGSAQAFGIALQPDGKAVVVGTRGATPSSSGTAPTASTTARSPMAACAASASAATSPAAPTSSC